MNQVSTLVIFIFSFLGFQYSTFAQLDILNYSVQKLTQDDGLSQGSNYFTFEDSKGFMWITANDALNRYDGNRVKVYNLNRYFKNCPNLQQGYGFAEDDSSNIYIGSTRGLYIYHRKSGLFTLQKIYNGDELVIPIAYNRGKVWCFNKQYELSTYDVVSKQVSIVQKISLPSLNEVHIYANSNYETLIGHMPFMDKFERIWFVGLHQLITYDTKTKTEAVVLLNNTNINLICCKYDKDDHQIVIGTDIGIVLFDAKTHIEQWIFKIGNTVLGNIEAIVKKGTLIACRSDKGLVFLNAANNQFHWVENTYLRFNRFFGFNFDKGNKLWMCDDGLGQVIYNFNQPVLPSMPGADADFEKLIETGVGEFAAFEDGDILVHDFAYFNLKNNKLVKIESNPVVANRFTTDTFRKGIWNIKTKGNFGQVYGIFFITKANQVLKHTIGKQFALGHCQNLQLMQDGNLLISFENGLCIYYPELNKFYKLKTKLI